MIFAPLPPDTRLISYLTLRRFVGVVAVALPVVVLFGHMIVVHEWVVQRSLSDYYHTSMRNIFVGSLCAIGVFLITYRTDQPRENRISNFAGGFMVLVAWFPVTAMNAVKGDAWVGVLHVVFAVVTFLLLAVIAWSVFTKSAAAAPMEKLRNRVYQACAVIMIGSIVAMGLLMLVPAGSPIRDLRPLFWLETLAIWAFGISWLVKGRILLNDHELVASLVESTEPGFAGRVLQRAL